MEEKNVGRGVQDAQRQPEREGEYAVMRRGIGGRPSYLDKAAWQNGKWHNSRGTVISSVSLWWEEGGKA